MHKPHKDLRAWQLGMEIVEAIYELTAKFPKSERFGLVSQLQRSAVSVPSNIAEGAARDSRLDFLRFLRVARGSLSELDTQLEISHRLQFIDGTGFRAVDSLLEEADKVLSGLIRYLENEAPSDD